jgi:hypothetical protein
MNAIAQNFIKNLSISKALGFDSLAVYTHASHECADFNKVIGQNNYWGIKVPQSRPWSGLIKTVWTTEYEPSLPNETSDQALIRLSKMYGSSQCEIQTQIKNSFGKQLWKLLLPLQFIDFGVTADAISWYCTDLIQRLYPNAYNNRSNAPSYFQGLVNGKFVYATDPNYVAALLARYKTLVADPTVTSLMP